MKKFTLSLLAVSSVLALTACGGGDFEDDKPSVASVIQPTSENAQFDPAKITDTAAEHPISGQHWHALHEDEKPSKFTLNNTNVGDDITKITIGDKTFNLVDTSKLSRLGEEQLGVEYGTTAHSRFGIAWQDLPDKTDADKVFYQGYQTLPKDMPTTGTAKYAGLAVHDCKDCNGKAKASFDVDFGKKTVVGVIDHKAQKVNLSATISGSSFSGVANGVQTNGAFYGVDASELSGIYKETGGKFVGAFGATKTE